MGIYFEDVSDLDLTLTLFEEATEFLNLYEHTEAQADLLAKFVQYVANKAGLATGDLKSAHLKKCDHACGLAQPYGFVSEDGCPIHDPPADWGERILRLVTKGDGFMNVQQSRDGRTWEPAQEEPYYPSLIEKVLHWLGRHSWTYGSNPKCLICGKTKADCH